MAREQPSAVLSAHKAQPHEERESLFLLGCGVAVLAALLLRAYQLGREPLWYDEVMYGYLAQHLNRAAMNGSFVLVEPAFIALLRGWLALAQSDAWLRCHALLAGMATLYPAWLLGRHLLGRRGGLFCLMALVPAPMLIFYSRDAKMYGWVIFLVLSTVYLALRCGGKDVRPRHFIAYIVTAVLLCNTHFAAPLYLGPLNLLFLLLFARRWRPTLAWVLSQILVIVCSLPFIFMELRYMKAMHGLAFHAPVPSMRSIWITLHNLLTAYSPQPLLHVAAVTLALSLGVAGFVFLSGNRKTLTLMLGVSIGSVGSLFWLSRTLEWSLYIDRYVVGAAGPLLVVMALGIASLPWRPLRIVVLLLWLAICGFALQDLYAKRMSPLQREHLGVVPAVDARAMADTIRKQKRPGDVVWHVYAETVACLRWYLPEEQHIPVDMGGQFQRYLDIICPRPFQAFHQWQPVEIERARVNASRVWLVIPDLGAGLDTLSRGTLEWLNARGTMLARRDSEPYYFAATLYLFDLQRPPGERRIADLSLQDPYERRGLGINPGKVTLSATRTPDDAGIVLEAESSSYKDHTLSYEVLFSDVLCPAAGFQRSLAERSSWNVQRYLANGKTRMAMLLRVHKGTLPQDVLTCTAHFPKGEYEAYVEHTVQGEKHAVPTALLRIGVNGVEFETPAATSSQAGGWTWERLGRVSFNEDTECTLCVGARDPENRVEAYALMSRVIFLRTTGSDSKDPVPRGVTTGTLTVPAKGKTAEQIAFPANARCADIVVQGPSDIADLAVARTQP